MNVLTKEQVQLQLTITKFQEYVAGYDNDFAVEHKYTNETFLHDMLYGLGLAIDSENYKWANGYKLFKEELIKKLIY